MDPFTKAQMEMVLNVLRKYDQKKRAEVLRFFAHSFCIKCGAEARMLQSGSSECKACGFKLGA